MKRLIDLQAPAAIIAMEAETLQSCFHYSWRWRWHRWKLSYTPHWLIWLLSRHYRDLCEDVIDAREAFEGELRQAESVKENAW
jgi:hypothetical protein